MKKILLVTASLVLMGTMVFASPWPSYHYGAFSGSDPFDRNNNSSGFINGTAFVYPDGVGALPSPGLIGESGEKFDLEGLKIKEDANYVYVSLANSFGYSAYSTSWRSWYDMGDLFIGKDGGGPQYAVDIFDIASNSSASTKLYSVDSWNYIDNRPGTYYSNAAVRNAAGAFELNAGTALGDVGMHKGYMSSYEQNPMKYYQTQTYVWEFAIDKSLLGDFNTLDFHVTMACGNDFMNETYEAIPEPTTMLLFGIGLLGAGAYRRFKH